MEWMVFLNGDETDLRELAKCLQRSDLTIEKDNESYYLKSTFFSSLTSSQEVREKANEILIPINAGIKIELGAPRPIGVDRVLQINPNGVNKGIISRESKFCIRVPNDTFNPQNFFLPLLDIAKTDIQVAKMCQFINLDLNSWFTLYNILEILEEDQFKPIMRCGIHKKEADRFTHTADNYRILGVKSRHAKDKNAIPPENPMTLSEAQEFIKMLIKEWLDEKGKKMM